MDIKPYKGRGISFGQLVEVYRTPKGKTWSIRDPKTKLVLAHADEIRLKNPTFIVSETGREQFRKTRKDNIHAYVRGTVATAYSDGSNPYWNLFYDPYTYTMFHYEDGNCIEHASMARFNSDGTMQAQN